MCACWCSLPHDKPRARLWRESLWMCSLSDGQVKVSIMTWRIDHLQILFFFFFFINAVHCAHNSWSQVAFFVNVSMTTPLGFHR